MSREIWLDKIKEFRTSELSFYFFKLFEATINDLRIKNDTANSDEVKKNQGAIRELDNIKKELVDIKDYPEEFHEVYDGAFGE